jgi:hypothetical protein
MWYTRKDKTTVFKIIFFMQEVNRHSKESKICSMCKMEKTIQDFYFRTDRGKPMNACKDCRNLYQRNKRCRRSKHKFLKVSVSIGKVTFLNWAKINKDNVSYLPSPLPEYNYVSPVNEEVLEVIEVNCSYFGCGRKLSLVEKLSGKVCLKHMSDQQPIYHNGLI